MANNWFRFKKFLVKQEGVAMKVGTDGVLLGAWAGRGDPQKILDVGTGTGLMSLMLAQRFPDALIDAVEIDDEAARMAKENFLASPWSKRLYLQHCSFQAFSRDSSKVYDLIVSNPPFFRKSKPAPLAARTRARHDYELPHEQLISLSVEQLSEKGCLSLILPPEIAEEASATCRMNGLYLSRILKVKPVPHKDFVRFLMEFSRKQQTLQEEELVIELSRHKYSAEYKKLTGEFYLDF